MISMWICYFSHNFLRSGLQVLENWPAGQIQLYHAGLSYSVKHIVHTQTHTGNGYFKPVDALLKIHFGFFSHCIKLRGLPLSAVTVSLHYLPRFLRSTASRNMWQNTYYLNLKWSMLLLCNKDQQQKNPPWSPSSSTILPQLHFVLLKIFALVQRAIAIWNSSGLSRFSMLAIWNASDQAAVWLSYAANNWQWFQGFLIFSKVLSESLQARLYQAACIPFVVLMNHGAWTKHQLHPHKGVPC